MALVQEDSQRLEAWPACLALALQAAGMILRHTAGMHTACWDNTEVTLTGNAIADS